MRRWPLFAAFGLAFGGGAFLAGPLWPIGATMIGLGILMGWLESRR